MESISSHIFLFAKDYRPMTLGWQGAPCSRRYGAWAGSKTGDFVKEKLGGAAVERLLVKLLA